MTVYTYTNGNGRKIYKEKKSIFEKILNFCENHEKILVTISVAVIFISGFLMSIAFGNPVSGV